MKKVAVKAGRYIGVFPYSIFYFPLDVVKDFVPFSVAISLVCFRALVSWSSSVTNELLAPEYKKGF